MKKKSLFVSPAFTDDQTLFFIGYHAGFVGEEKGEGKIRNPSAVTLLVGGGSSSPLADRFAKKRGTCVRERKKKSWPNLLFVASSGSVDYCNFSFFSPFFRPFTNKLLLLIVQSDSSNRDEFCILFFKRQQHGIYHFDVDVIR